MPSHWNTCLNACHMETLPDLQSKPVLASRALLRKDPATGNPVLLYPEGVMILNTTAHDILMRCDGQSTVASLLDVLSDIYKAEPEKLHRDVLGCLHALSQ